MGLISRVSSRTYRDARKSSTMPTGNPWLDDEPSSSSRGRGGFDPNKDYLQEHVTKQKQTLESQQRALRVLTETEQIGADTAVELKRQGEVLNRAETKVDNINENLNVAEYHVRTIKSWFGGLTNKFRKQPPRAAAAQEENHENDMETEQVNHQAETATELVNNMNRQDTANQARNQPSYKNSSPHQPTQFDLYENQIDSNLDQMSSGLSRLKDLGMGLNTEINKQNNQLERLNNKMSKVDDRTANVNQVLRRLNN